MTLRTTMTTIRFASLQLGYQLRCKCNYTLILLSGALTGVACSGTDSSTGGIASVGGAMGSGGSNTAGATGAGGSSPSSTGGATTVTASGGSAATGGQGSSSGGVASTGGAVATGGAASATGGSPAVGGNQPTGGSVSTGGASLATGGRTAGGANATGGASATTGGKSSGGASTTGGATTAGGASQTTGGKSATGGLANTGGSTNSGGVAATGGTAGTGGSTLPPHVCAEPTPWVLPTTSRVVGTGTAASCTYSALNTAVTAGGSITFNCGTAPVTIAVTSAITASKPTVVDGAGLVTLDGGGTNQIFLGASNNTLSVRNLTFINGKAPSASDATGIGGAVSGNWRSQVEVIGCTFKNNTAARGGGAVAVWTGSSLTIASSRFTSNTSWYGGAVYSLLSPLTVVNSEFTSNTTVLQSGYGDGGAIGTDGASESTTDSVGGTIQICGTQIRSSQGNGSGGGAYIWMYPPDQVIIDRSTIESNNVVKNADSQGAIGGAMRISNGAITIKDSSFLSNTSIGNGGGLYLDCAPTCNITNSTFYGNKNTAGWGGAIFSGTSSGQISMDNVTFASNNQQNTSGNATFGSATWVINNSIFYNDGCATKGTGAHVLESGSSSTCISGAISGNPQLGAPADNGGPTYTMLPATGSAALQVGANCEAADQRGQARDTAACDVGSVEVP